MSNMIVHIEHTDTFGGEANYCWVIRESFPCARGTSTTQIIRKVKNILGLSGIRHTKEDYGDSITLDYAGICARTFITFEFEESNQSAISYNQ